MTLHILLTIAHVGHAGEGCSADQTLVAEGISMPVPHRSLGKMAVSGSLQGRYRS